MGFIGMRSLWVEYRQKRTEDCALGNPIRDEGIEKPEKQTDKKTEVCGDLEANL